MKPTVILLFGKTNSGKTATIELAYRLLCEQYKQLSDRGNYGCQDFKAVMTVGEVKVGCFSGGDNRHVIDDAIGYFERHKCEVCICAARGEPDDQTYILIETFATTNDRFDFKPVDKSWHKKFAKKHESDKEFAAKIVNIVNHVL